MAGDRTALVRRWLRSFLFAPGDSERLLAKVFTAGADAVVLDLEDAVAESRKAEARRLVNSKLQTLGEDHPPAWVRINAVNSAHWQEDLAAVVVPGLAGLRPAKIESLDELQQLDDALYTREEQAGLATGSIQVTCEIESAAGLMAASALGQHPRVERFSFGEADFMADLGAEPGSDPALPRATLWARSMLVVVSRAARLAAPIVPIYTRFGDLEGLHRRLLECKELGFFGASCIHPKQLGPIHEAFTPRPREVAAARELLEVFEQGGGGGTSAAGERFVDAAVVRHAREVLALAEHLATKEGRRDR